VQRPCVAGACILCVLGYRFVTVGGQPTPACKVGASRQPAGLRPGTQWCELAAACSPCTSEPVQWCATFVCRTLVLRQVHMPKGSMSAGCTPAEAHWNRAACANCHCDEPCSAHWQRQQHSTQCFAAGCWQRAGATSRGIAQAQSRVLTAAPRLPWILHQTVHVAHPALSILTLPCCRPHAPSLLPPAGVGRRPVQAPAAQPRHCRLCSVRA
jgi:hypothetical protein